MIVISGVLVLVALVLLVLGVTQSDINLVYGCIVVSLVSLVFLVLGIVQRRGEVLPGATTHAEPTPGGTTSAPSALGSVQGGALDVEPDQDDDSALDPDDDPDDPDDAQEHGGTGGIAAGGADGRAPAVAGMVLVVANRPRYHVDGCRYLVGEQAQQVDVVDAREAGFTACGVCKPDARQGATDAQPQAGFDGDGSFSEESTGETLARQGSTPVAAAPAPHADAPAPVPAAGTQPDTQVQPAARPSPGVAPEPAAGQVVVIPDRNRYHRADCRHVRDTAGAETLETSQARRQGYAACGVCNP